MSNLVVTNINGQDAQVGKARAWCSYNSVTPATNASYGISSVTDNATGDATFNFTTSFASSEYCIATAVGEDTGVRIQAMKTKLAGSLRSQTMNSAGTYSDVTDHDISFLGDLA